jgi:hypothetical protein
MTTLSDNRLTLKEINELLSKDSNTIFYAEKIVKQFIKIILNKPQRITYRKWIKQNAGEKLI